MAKPFVKIKSASAVVPSQWPPKKMSEDTHVPYYLINK